LPLTPLWLQQGIWKTFQSRATDAIIAIEDELALNESEQSSRPNLSFRVREK